MLLLFLNSYLKLIVAFFIANSNRKWKVKFQILVTKINRIEEKNIQKNCTPKENIFSNK